MENTDITSKKNKLIELVQEIVIDYHQLNDKLLQEKNLSMIEMKSMNDVIQEQERMSQHEMNLYSDLEKELKQVKKQNHEYEGIIRELQDKVLEKQNEEKSHNKFNMMIAQANELEAKDREIERLNKLVFNLKHPDENKSSEPPVNEENNTPIVDNLVNEVKEELSNDKVLTFVYRKNTYYYKENDDNNVYDSETFENCIGKWGQTKTGRMKLI